MRLLLPIRTAIPFHHRYSDKPNSDDPIFYNLKDRKNFLYESDGTGELLDTGFTAVEELKAA